MNECHVPNCQTCAAIERVSREFHFLPPEQPKPSRVIPVKSTTIETGSFDEISLAIASVIGVIVISGTITIFALWALRGFQ